MPFSMCNISTHKLTHTHTCRECSNINWDIGLLRRRRRRLANITSTKSKQKVVQWFRLSSAIWILHSQRRPRNSINMCTTSLARAHTLAHPPPGWMSPKSLQRIWAELIDLQVADIVCQNVSGVGLSAFTAYTHGTEKKIRKKTEYERMDQTKQCPTSRFCRHRFAINECIEFYAIACNRVLKSNGEPHKYICICVRFTIFSRAKHWIEWYLNVRCWCCCCSQIRYGAMRCRSFMLTLLTASNAVCGIMIASPILCHSVSFGFSQFPVRN